MQAGKARQLPLDTGSRKMLKTPCLLAATAALAGCATPDGAYPDLSIRATERVSGTMAAPPPPYEPPPVAAGTMTRSSQLVASAAAAHREFLASAPATRDHVRAASGAARDSERWARAQVAIAGLEARRAAVMIALADLDRLTVDAAIEGQQFAALGEQRDEVAALADRQTRLLAEMLQSLAR